MKPVRNIGVFANTTRTALDHTEKFLPKPTDQSEFHIRYHYLSPRIMDMKSHRGLSVDEVHLFGTLDEMQAWLSEFILTPEFLPVLATSEDPKIVLHPGATV